MEGRKSSLVHPELFCKVISDGVFWLIGCKMALIFPDIDSMVVDVPIGRSAAINPEIV